MKRSHGIPIAPIFCAGTILALGVIPFEGDNTQFPPISVVAMMYLCMAIGIGIMVRPERGVAVGITAGVAVILVATKPGGGTAQDHVIPGFLLAFATAAGALRIASAAISTQVQNDDRIYFGVSSYILIGIAFALIHQRVAVLNPGAYRFDATTRIPNEGTWADFYWLSFSTLTTAGFADITPVQSWSRLICALEAITGVIYPAVFLARMVGASTASPTPPVKEA